MSADTARPRRRADAERSIARIVTAARATLSTDPHATVDDIVKAAGVGRMTLYGHFRTRQELVEAALADALRAGEETLAHVDLTGDARDALTRLLESSWSLVAESAALVEAAQGVLPAGRMRELHAAPAERLNELIERGRRQGVFRTDLPVFWLINTVHYVLHGAAEEIRAGRLDSADAGRVIVATVQAIVAVPVGTGGTASA
ncbi:TetR/AcrR family transcriptional regulator [Phytoactinopolyspora halotolerans]|uniref:TetR/AcrR family transcriptional regulator n=1 Tax=Phytoactinopolyspora halotolerans TaxID=1981512 RepID=A0A6L9S903_9ACTN|nr:TetR/AcrR family transcriptional regulator [Phytoactinopolyspora halotolerans]NEE01084.1 TetR/AcrR family transcriptional regulator [Phytoactinopolyspora halotolerans]